MKNYIVLAGNIGAGKSTLVDRISENLGWKPYYEPVSENPYLEDFYKNMKKWAFHSQLYFLTDRLRTHKHLQDYNGSIVQDRSVYEDAEIFAKNLFLQGSITPRDFETYQGVYTLFLSFLDPPDLVVFLRASVETLKKRITMRGREFEVSIPDSYLENLNRLYDIWIESFTLCPVLEVDTGEIDIVSRPEDLEFVVSMIQKKLKGKQQVLFE
ncbi:MAG: deoxynucleoside kinase [Spirochaetales bacterium]|nr:deoxynucleoside kinase [Spirochaetales bacterium]